jgi:DNA (cytosine-5)-methyltransferase 1
MRGRVDLVFGGFPCQDISLAGRGAGLAGARSGLWFEMLRIIREVRPRVVFLENVAAITFRGLDAVLGSLAESGYDAEWLCLQASDVGATHRRDRWFCLAYQRGNRWRQGSEISQEWESIAAAQGEAVAYRRSDGRGWRRQQGANEWRSEPSARSSEVADAMRAGGQQDAGSLYGNEGQDEGRPAPDGDLLPGNGGALGAFPPGPGDRDAWSRILKHPPHLAPAVESGVRLLADGLAVVVDESRADQLRCAGNGVVPLQAAAAFVELARRAELKL